MIKYASNIPDFERYDLIRLFTNGVLYGIKQSEEGDYVRKYDYIWIDLENISNSSLLSYYENAKEVYSEGKKHVYVIHLV